MHEQLLMCRKIQSWAAAHIRVPRHEQLLMCKKNDTHEQLIIEGGGFHAGAATHVQRKHDIHEQLLIYIFIYIYRGTHAWAATHVQKNKWHSREAAHIGVPMHEQLLMCRKNNTHEQLLMCKKKWHSWATAQKKGYSCTWAAAHVQEKNGHEQLLMWGYSCMSSCSWVQNEFYHAWAKSKGRKSPSKGRKYPSKGRIYPVMIFGHHGSQKKHSNQKRTLAAKKSWVTTKIHEQPKTHQ